MYALRGKWDRWNDLESYGACPRRVGKERYIFWQKKVSFSFFKLFIPRIKVFLRPCLYTIMLLGFIIYIVVRTLFESAIFFFLHQNINCLFLIARAQNK